MYHSCLTRVSLVSHSCLTRVSLMSHSCLTRVSLMSHSCLCQHASHFDRHVSHFGRHVSLMSLMYHLCLYHVSLMYHSCLTHVSLMSHSCITNVSVNMHHTLIDPAKLHLFGESRTHQKMRKSLIQACANLWGTSMSFLPYTCDAAGGLQCPKETSKRCTENRFTSFKHTRTHVDRT